MYLKLLKAANLFLLMIFIKILHNKIIESKKFIFSIERIKDIEENNEIFKYKNPLKCLEKLSKKNNTIAVSYAIDNEYIYPTIVSMTSLVYNAGNNTFYNTYILQTPDLINSSKNFLNSV